MIWSVKNMWSFPDVFRRRRCSFGRLEHTSAVGGGAFRGVITPPHLAPLWHPNNKILMRSSRKAAAATNHDWLQPLRRRRAHHPRMGVDPQLEREKNAERGGEGEGNYSDETGGGRAGTRDGVVIGKGEQRDGEPFSRRIDLSVSPQKSSTPSFRWWRFPTGGLAGTIFHDSPSIWLGTRDV